MSKELCVIHANCQADPVMQLLAIHPEFSRRFRLQKFTNYLQEKIPPEALKTCTLFIYQHLGSKWGDTSSDTLLSQIAPAAERLAIPNMLFKGYWPFWKSGGLVDFCDAYLETLLGMKLAKKEILYMYLTANLSTKYDLQAMFDESIAHERNKEEGCIVHSVDLVLEWFQQEKIFSTINHPAKRLILHVTNAILRALGMRPLSATETALLENDPYPDFHLPIHPQVANFHGLSFANEKTLYSVYGKQKTFEEYIHNYVDCRLLDIDNFVGYLHLV